MSIDLQRRTVIRGVLGSLAPGALPAASATSQVSNRQASGCSVAGQPACHLAEQQVADALRGLCTAFVGVSASGDRSPLSPRSKRRRRPCTGKGTYGSQSGFRPSKSCRPALQATRSIQSLAQLLRPGAEHPSFARLACMQPGRYSKPFNPVDQSSRQI